MVNKWGKSSGISYGLNYEYNRANSWSFDYSTNQYLNTFTGERVDAQETNPAEFLPNKSYELSTYAIYESGTSIDGGKTFTGNGNFGIVKVGIMRPTKDNLIFTSRGSAQDFLTKKDPWFTLDPYDKAVAAVGLFGTTISNSKGTFRIKKNGRLSFKYYSSGWRTGNQFVNKLYSVSKVGSGVTLGADVYVTINAYNNIYSGQAQTGDFIDAFMGPMGMANSSKLLLTGSSIPIVGEFVALYSILNLTWDIFYDLGAEYGPINR